MSKYRVILLLVSILLISNCSGGGNGQLPPSSRDLSGMEGIWSVSYNYTGHQIDIGDCELVPVSGNTSTQWIVNTDSIEFSPCTVEYSYDGVTLIVRFTYNYEDEIQVETIISTYTIQIQPHEKSGSLVYQREKSHYHDRCGTTLEATLSGTGTVTLE